MVTNTIEKLLKDGLKIIKERDYNNPFLDVQVILAYLLKKDRIYLYIHKNEIVDEETIEKYYKMLQKRNNGYPLQYIVNSQEFMGLEFFVREGVLIPRPDTEILVEKIINIAKNKLIKKEEINILDIGTGSGAIAISLAYYLRKAKVTAIDNSEISLEIAKINAEKHNIVNISINKGDLFNNLNAEEKFDIVVSNPPYIETDEIKKLQTEVSVYEPKEALDGGKDGLKYYREIVKKFSEISREKGILGVEIGNKQKEKVIKIFNNYNNFSKIENYKDYSGNDRVIIGYKCL